MWANFVEQNPRPRRHFQLDTQHQHLHQSWEVELPGAKPAGKDSWNLTAWAAEAALEAAEEPLDELEIDARDLEGIELQPVECD